MLNIPKLLKNVDLKNFSNRLPFTQHKEATDTILTALLTGQNAILYGPGGYGKTDLLTCIFRKLDIDYYVISGHSQMTVEDLLGVPNMNKLMKESKLELNFENTSFIREGVIIIEEGTDIPANVLTCLKDLITNKGYRYGNKTTKMNISNIFITGNTDPKNLETEDSIKAFFEERFPLKSKVYWESHDLYSYLALWNCHYSQEFIQSNKSEFLWLAKACANNDQIISPRIALEMCKILLVRGVEFLKNTNLTISKTLYEDYKNINELSEINTNIINAYDRYNQSSDKLNFLNEILNSHKFTDSAYHDMLKFFKLKRDEFIEEISNSNSV